MNSNKSFTVLFTAIAMMAIISLPKIVLAKQDPVERKYWFYYRAEYKPTPARPSATITCDKNRQKILAGFILRTGINVQTNLDVPLTLIPAIGGDLEFCNIRYKDADWAPSRLGLEFLFNRGNDKETKPLLNFGFGIRSQWPLYEQLDLGAYLKYVYLHRLNLKINDRHDIVFGALIEYRPWYEASAIEFGGLFVTARLGLGVDYSETTKKTGQMFEFFSGIGYRFTEF